jgi:D-3-phosphoglycerate dehydrogenase/(S)-sulfolactate dehydrogenase
MKIFVSWPDFEAEGAMTGRALRDAGHELVLEPKLGARSGVDVARLAEGCAGAIVSTDPFPAEVLAALPEMKIIARVGVGYDSIDIGAATRQGVAVSITPGMNAETVADHTLALMLGLVRKVAEQDARVKAGHWDRTGAFAPSEMLAKTVGLVGVGAIGRAVIRRLAGFGVRILFHDSFVAAVEGAEKVENLDALLAEADIVSLHVPMLPETHHLIDAVALAGMKPSALLVNTSRGPVVDQEALFAALKTGAIGGAALDVFETEPPSAEALAGAPNLLCAAHLGGISRESVARMTASATRSVISVLAGEMPETVVNRAALRERV